MHATCGLPFMMEHKHAAHLMSDGMVSVAGQRHPLFEPVVAETFTSFADISKKIKPGVWFHFNMPESWNHMETMRYGQKQIKFFSALQNFLLLQ